MSFRNGLSVNVRISVQLALSVSFLWGGPKGQVAHAESEDDSIQCIPVSSAVTPLLPEDAKGDEASTPLCPQGTVPQPKVVWGPKGMPVLPAESSEVLTSDNYYYYAGGYQYVEAVATQSWFTVHEPYVQSGDAHSLAEVAVSSLDGQNIVEAGWMVSPSLYGDSDPHLFVFSWANSVPGCYNGCGWVQTSSLYYPGMNLEDMADECTSTYDLERFIIYYTSGNWWVYFHSEWIGYFPGTLWDDSFTKLELVIWFGEVCTPEMGSTSDMGSGAYAQSRYPASFENLELLDASGVKSSALPAPLVTKTRYYSVKTDSSSSFTYGGPGSHY